MFPLTSPVSYIAGSTYLNLKDTETFEELSTRTALYSLRERSRRAWSAVRETGRLQVRGNRRWRRGSISNAPLPKYSVPGNLRHTLTAPRLQM